MFSCRSLCFALLACLPALTVAETKENTQTRFQPFTAQATVAQVEEPLLVASCGTICGHCDNDCCYQCDDKCCDVVKQCEADCCDDTNNRFFASATYVHLSRRETGGPGRDLIYSDNNASQDVPIQPITRPQGVALDTNAFDQDFEPGVLGTVGFCCCDGGVEATFLYLSEDKARLTLSVGDYSLGTQLQNNNQNPNAVNIDTTVASVQNLLSITAVTADRSTDLRSFEINYVKQWQTTDCMYHGTNCGVRGLLIDEDISMSLTTSGGGAEYTSEAKNRILGLQGGCYFGYADCLCGDFSADIRVGGKAGAGFNVASLEINMQNADLANNPNGPDDSTTDGATFAEAQLTVGLSVNSFALVLGYYALMVDSVELGGVPAQLFLFGSDPIPACDTVFYHGFTAALGFCF